MMKRINILVLLCTAFMLSNAQTYTYLVQFLGDDGYDILNIPHATLEETGSTFGYQSDCRNIPGAFNFSYPSRNTDTTNQKFTLLKYKFLQQNWITGAFEVVYESDDWEVGNTSPTDAEFLNYNPELFDGVQFIKKPFCRYYMEIKTRKGKQNIFGNPVPVITSLTHTGYTESIDFGSCQNVCRPYPYGYDLTIINSGTAYFASGNYNPLYEAEGEITASVHLGYGEQLILDSGTEITLLPGFHADFGSDFVAYIDGCGGRSSEPNEEDKQSENDYNDVLDKSVHIENVTLDTDEVNRPFDIRLYPNPSNGQYTLEIGQYNNYGFVEIQSLSGLVVFQKNITSPTLSIDICNEANGIYFVRLYFENQVITKKIIKQ